jgi:hypothetical protein
MSKLQDDDDWADIGGLEAASQNQNSGAEIYPQQVHSGQVVPSSESAFESEQQLDDSPKFK